MIRFPLSQRPMNILTKFSILLIQSTGAVEKHLSNQIHLLLLSWKTKESNSKAVFYSGLPNTRTCALIFLEKKIHPVRRALLLGPVRLIKFQKKNSWCVKYFEPSVKGKFQVLNDTVFDVFRKDLYEKVPTPDLKQQGKSHMYYLFQK